MVNLGPASQFYNPISATAGGISARYLPELGTLLGLKDSDETTVWNTFGKLPGEQQNLLALEIFYHVLRDTGRDFNSANGSEKQS